ncbi:MAG: 23S rRNA (adenine(2503)-C(2))-methyltransferase RlmN [Deltaproteobacteria bacterium]|nr:23S rRNA (adenine(2503)-C(2))-methyltransferase RlmN [Deltaproteobacteria bacterium]
MTLPAAQPTTQDNIYALTEEQLQAGLEALGQPKFRARQVCDWVYRRGVTSFDEMTNLPKDLRADLAGRYRFGHLSLVTSQRSQDGTEKRLYRLPDGQLIESVLMPYGDGRRTACISSQAGCAMGCTFCATGQMGFERHLSAEEIFEQAQRFSADLQRRGERLSNCVLMGMGEPFHNYDNVVKALRLIMERLDIGARRITVSTVGLVPKIKRFAEEGLQVKLAISLHATRDEEREAIMPVNKRYPVRELIDACHDFVRATGRRVTFEWALIQGQNDSVEEAARLAALLRGLLCHVNVIPLNPTAGYGGAPSDPERVGAFVQTLEERGVPATVRMRRGIDIDAGCGQLKSSAEQGLAPLVQIEG